MKSFFTLIIALVTCFALGLELQAQYPGNGGRTGGGRPGGGQGMPKITITGKIVDATSQEPMEFATVSIYSKRDSSLLSGGITLVDGTFKVESRPGKLFAKIEFIGYDPLVIEQVPINRETRSADLGVIQLGASALALDAVEVRAEKSTMQLSLDKKVFNVGKDLANNGGTAEDLLNNVPSVTVDIEGNVSLRNSSNVRILVDGKPSIMFSNGNGLKALPSNLIEKIEVVTNPSAKYEAEGMAGIINIVMRKEKKKGLNGSFDFTVGVPDNYATAINLNYRKNDFNFFINYGIRYRKGPGIGTNYQEFWNNDTLYITDQTRLSERGGFSNNVRLGADYYFNEKNILTTSFSYRAGKEDNLTELTYNDFLYDIRNATGSTFRTDNEIEDESNLEYALSYEKKFARKGQRLTADVRYTNRQEVESSDFVENYFDGAGNALNIANLQQRSNNDEGSNQLIIRGDYEQPFGEDGKFETGFQVSDRNINNDFLVEEWADNLWKPLEGLNNNFIYDEKIYAAYGTYGNKIDKFGYQVGVRAEHTDVRTELLETNEVNPRKYTNLFPSLFLNYDLPRKNAIQLSYSRRVRRPRFRDLNPFFTFSDARNFYSGNPDLDPEFTHSMELGHIKYWEKGSFNTAIFYRHTTDVIQRIINVNSDGTTFTRPENLLTRDDVGLEFNYSTRPTDWWRLNGDLSFFQSMTAGGEEYPQFDVETFTWNGRMTSIMTIAKEVDFQLRANYRAPRETSQGRSKSMTSIDLGLSKDILKKKGTLTLSVRDLLNSRRRRYESFIYDDFNNLVTYREGDFQWRARQATLTLNYRLNQSKRRGRGGRGGGGYGGGEGGEF